MILSFISRVAIYIDDFKFHKCHGSGSCRIGVVDDTKFFSDPAHAACIGGSPFDCSGCN
jgi:hypothetical protein